MKTKATGQTNNNGRIDNIEIMIPLKYLSIFGELLNLVLTWSADCVIIYNDVVNQFPTFAITETNVPVVTLSTQIINTIKIRF